MATKHGRLPGAAAIYLSQESGKWVSFGHFGTFWPFLAVLAGPWRRTISDVMEAESVFSRPFLDVFGDEFRILEIQLENGLDVEQIIDRVEESENDSMKIDYDRNATWCEIKISPIDLAVRVHADRIRVISSKGITPQGLVAEYYEIQRQFIYEADWDVPDPSGE